MPYIKNTPESIVSRSDSKNPATTCRGITASGLPCRRSLASPPNSSPTKTAGVKASAGRNTDITVFYCWQHKDQAESILRRKTWNLDPQKQRRSSIDTLMDRLGVLDINDTSEKPNKVPPKKKQTRHTFCCFTIIEDEEPPLAAKPRPTHPSPARPHQQVNKTSSSGPKIQPSSKPNSLLPWIPASLSPQTASLLLAELAKPISPADEPGYIYMFWITPSTSPKSDPPPSDIAPSLLPSVHRDMSSDTDESDESPEQIQRSNTAIRRARDLNTLSSVSSPNSPGTVRLKIGRTSNVTRRLNEWSKQCSNHLTLIRYYPYTSSSQRQGQNDGLEPGKKVPHVHRVERLIHLELADMRIRDLGPCPECGKEHREWFEVAAERAALKRVDECIRRWVRWAHTQK
ncbi:meiotically up-regulated gene 113-domain-containing protein [Aspergillus terricola var. indicus]